MKKKILSVLMCTMLSIPTLVPAYSVKAEELDIAPATIPAFPGAEGGGIYTSGGRSYEVVYVTNLNDSGAGSLREAISVDNRTIVFSVSGTIYLNSALSFSGRKNITVAGQTAPGDGICIANNEVNLSDSQNIIVRYLRFRPGSQNITSEYDSIGGRGAKYVMVDHISASWSSDETASFYDNNHVTIQWSIISESLTLAGHVKGKHGYGGLNGGPNETYHHNLLMDHVSRLPRFCGSSAFTFANNVVYNWGFNNAYAGSENLLTNFVNNYFKPGPSTVGSVKNQLINPGVGQFYIAGNYLYGNEAVTTDNSKGIRGADAKTIFVDAAFNNDTYNTIAIDTAEEAYTKVLSKAGATYPKRDAIDARLVQDVKEGTGRVINREYEVGGYPELKSVEAPLDTDKDGMPDAWEEAHGLNKSDKTDGQKVDPSTIGYTYLEGYLNSLDKDFIPDNPVVNVITPTYNGLYAEGGQMVIDVAASDADGIDKVEFYVGAVYNSRQTDPKKMNTASLTKVAEDLTAPYSYTLENIVEGQYYITAVAYDTKGNATQSTSMPVCVNGAEVSGTWNSVDIGAIPVQGSGSLDNSTGILTVKGSGKITGTKDSCHFVYQPINGNASLTARLDYSTLLDENAISGLMIRDSLEAEAAEAIIGTSIIKGDRDEKANGAQDDTFWYTFFSSRMNKGEKALAVDEKVYPGDTLPAENDCTLPLWLRIERVDNVIIAYTSYDNITWKELTRKTFSMSKEAYIGFVVDATQGNQGWINYNTAKFSNIKLEDSFNVIDVALTDILGNSVTSVTAGGSISVVATVAKNSLAIEDAVIAVELSDANDKVIATSYVKSKFAKGATKTIKAGFSTPNNIDGIKIKAFVVNNVKDGMKISNEVAVK